MAIGLAEDPDAFGLRLRDGICNEDGLGNRNRGGGFCDECRAH